MGNRDKQKKEKKKPKKTPVPKLTGCGDTAGPHSRAFHFHPLPRRPMGGVIRASERRV